MMYALGICHREISKDSIVFSGPCMVTGEQYSVKISREDFERYQSGLHIQDAMPSISREDREFLISGFSPKGWAQVFGTGMR